MENCIFCELPRQSFSSEGELTFTILDQFPVSLGHTLIVPKRHFKTFFDATEEEVVALMSAVQQAKMQLDSEFNPDGYNIGINNGDAAGQTVPHLHIHLIPRYKGDIEDPRGGVRWVLPDKAKYWKKENA